MLIENFKICQHFVILLPAIKHYVSAPSITYACKKTYMPLDFISLFLSLYYLLLLLLLFAKVARHNHDRGLILVKIIRSSYVVNMYKIINLQRQLFSIDITHQSQKGMTIPR